MKRSVLFECSRVPAVSDFRADKKKWALSYNYIEQCLLFNTRNVSANL